MPTYFFDLIKGNELVEDDQGDDFVDIEAAKLEGLASARGDCLKIGGQAAFGTGADELLAGWNFRP